MKTWCEQLLAEQYAEDRSKAYYVDESGEWKWYITERGRYSKVDFLAGYKAAKEQFRSTTKEAGDKLTPTGWISVKDRLPEEGEEVLVFGQYLNDIPKVLGVKSRYKGDQDWKYTWEGSDEWVYREDDVTHWMPLPEPPKEEK